MESSCVPPGFRFHPTDEELVGYYLKKKVGSERIDLDVIRDVDLYRIEPWDLQDRCRIGYEQQNDWYFFSHKDKKYPTGTRTNRATLAGFWKATGRDKAVHDKLRLIGMRKTLVFYKGRAPHGQKTDWIIHEYRLQTHPNAPPQEEGWVVCRAFKKRIPNINNMRPIESCFLHRLQPSPILQHPSPTSVCKEEFEFDQLCLSQFFDLPLLETSSTLLPLTSETEEEEEHVVTVGGEKVTDWRALDRFVASQLSPDEGFMGGTLEKGLEDNNLRGLLAPDFDIGVFVFEN